MEGEDINDFSVFASIYLFKSVTGVTVEAPVCFAPCSWRMGWINKVGQEGVETGQTISGETLAELPLISREMFLWPFLIETQARSPEIWTSKNSVHKSFVHGMGLFPHSVTVKWCLNLIKGRRNWHFWCIQTKQKVLQKHMDTDKQRHASQRLRWPTHFMQKVICLTFSHTHTHTRARTRILCELSQTSRTALWENRARLFTWLRSQLFLKYLGL